jgi:hypothetical protein
MMIFFTKTLMEKGLDAEREGKTQPSDGLPLNPMFHRQFGDW